MDSYRAGTAPTDPSVIQIIGDPTPGAPPPEAAPPAHGYTPEAFALLLKKLVLHPTSFSIHDTRVAFNHLAEPNGAHPSQIGAFLSALRLTGKDGEPSIVAECAKVMQEHALQVDVGNFGEGPVCDIVGTGGDGHNTFNVSTTAAIVAAGAGLRVYKHGNKAATSSSGSADILLSLGCPVTTLPPTSLHTVASRSPFLFLFAPLYHPSMVRVAPIRKQIAFPTVFNALGPLINPAKPKAMIVGVHSPYLGPIFAEALRITGVERAWVVCGAEGLDEISPAGDTHVWDLQNGTITERTLHPSHFGLTPTPLSTVAGGTPLENSLTLISLLDGALPPTNPIENFVVLNAAALLLVAGVVQSEKEGVERARRSIAEGGAKRALEAFRVASSEAAKLGQEEQAQAAA
ncbi:hypothetical protein Rhopal_005854-T1 [Rhodotorula paludigena]|uniref:Anthranilate phosphoribosyltransferase n=1 Tax=Rhodotorula paludigena TaxID=86838 RepID=A0AAV5GTH3_9BASI|nr:hypothetical protein Rhopal_005854-T1 [Rhodotorula paludigena]